jgi:DNA-binding GntR family transcriptional regulator
MKSSFIRPVEKQSAEAQATDSLREFILSGAAKPGSRLLEMSLADQMGIARATLRTGLHKLASEGIVVQIPYTGWQVARLTADDAWELWTLRGSLESLAAKLAAESGDTAGRENIETAYDDLANACRRSNLKKISETDFALHRAIVEASGHTRLLQQYLLVEQQVRLYISSSNDLVKEGPSAILEQHRPMVEALLNGDSAMAAQQAWLHNETEGSRLATWLRRQNASD